MDAAVAELMLNQNKYGYRKWHIDCNMNSSIVQEKASKALFCERLFMHKLHLQQENVYFSLPNWLCFIRNIKIGP